MVYVNTVSVLEAQMILRAVGAAAQMVVVLLTASDQVATQRLADREIDSALQIHIQRSAAAALWLQEQAGRSVVRLTTDGRTVGQVAADVVNFTGWTK